MTIFLIIAKENLIKKLKEGRDNSISADHGLGNSLASLLGSPFGWGRDPSVSSKKQLDVDKYLLALANMRDEENDEATAVVLGKLIQECEDKVKAYKSAGFDSSNIGIALGYCHEILRKLKNELFQSNLMDIPYDDDPLNKLRYQMAGYIWHTVINSTPLAEDRKKEVKLKLAECEKDLAALDKENKEYPQSYKKTILTCIRDLRMENGRLSTKHGVSVSVPFSVTIGVTLNFDTDLFIPGLGELERYCCLAIQDISGQAVQQEMRPSELSSIYSY